MKELIILFVFLQAVTVFLIPFFEEKAHDIRFGTQAWKANELIFDYLY